jgi:hypothetical protein
MRIVLQLGVKLVLFILCFTWQVPSCPLGSFVRLSGIACVAGKGVVLIYQCLTQLVKNMFCEIGFGGWHKYLRPDKGFRNTSKPECCLQQAGSARRGGQEAGGMENNSMWHG